MGLQRVLDQRPDGWKVLGRAEHFPVPGALKGAEPPGLGQGGGGTFFYGIWNCVVHWTVGPDTGTGGTHSCVRYPQNNIPLPVPYSNRRVAQ